MKSKDIAIVGILLAIGAILRYFLAMLHTPQILAKYATMQGFIIVFVPIVVGTAVFNAIIVQILYIPSSRVLSRGQE